MSLTVSIRLPTNTPNSFAVIVPTTNQSSDYQLRQEHKAEKAELENKYEDLRAETVATICKPSRNKVKRLVELK
jgi:hypothetical protein